MHKFTEWVRDAEGPTKNGLVLSPQVLLFGMEANYVGFCLHQDDGVSPRVEFQIRNGRALELCTNTDTWIHSVPSDWLCLCSGVTKYSGACSGRLCCTNSAGTGGRLMVHFETPEATVSSGIYEGLEDDSLIENTKTSRGCVDYTRPEFTYMTDNTGNCGTMARRNHR